MHLYGMGDLLPRCCLPRWPRNCTNGMRSIGDCRVRSARTFSSWFTSVQCLSAFQQKETKETKD